MVLPASIRVMGVDPGSRFLGFGVLERHPRSIDCVGHGVLRLSEKEPLEVRLAQIHAGLGAAIDLHRPGAIAVEGIFTFKNARSALILGHARGVVLLLAALRGLPVFEYAPARVKRAVGAGGRGDKGAVARMLARQLRLDVTPERADAWDALAVALCHLHAPAAPAGMGARATRSVAFAQRLRPAFSAPAGGLT